MVFKLLAYFALIMITMKSLLAFLSVFKPFVRAPFAKLYSVSSEHVSYVVTDKGNIVKAFKEATQLAAHARIEEEEYDASCDDERENDISEPEEQIDDEEDDYNASERDIDSAFEKIKRLPCFCHLLQCAVRDIDKANLGAAVRQKAKALCSKFRSSHKATHMLRDKTGKILFSFTVTRMSSLYLMFQHLLSLKDAVHDVLQEIPDLEAQELTIREYQSLQSDFTHQLEAEDCTTLSSVLVAIVELRHHLEQTVSAAQDFKPIYCIATYLDPRFCSILRVLNLMDVAMDNVQQNYAIRMDENDLPEPLLNRESEEAESPAKRTYLEELLSKEDMLIQERQQPNPLDSELESYQMIPRLILHQLNVSFLEQAMQAEAEEIELKTTSLSVK
eukprot:Em0018g457a